MKKKAKLFKNNPVPMPRSDDAGWIIHCELFIQRMQLAFMLNTLLASFDFLFHYSLCSVALRNPNLSVSESLFCESEKKNTWETTFGWCWCDTSNPSLGTRSLAGTAFSWNSGKRMFLRYSAADELGDPGQTTRCPVPLAARLENGHGISLWKAGYVKDDRLPGYYGNWKST